MMGCCLLRGADSWSKHPQASICTRHGTSCSARPLPRATLPSRKRNPRIARSTKPLHVVGAHHHSRSSVYVLRRHIHICHTRGTTPLHTTIAVPFVRLEGGAGSRRYKKKTHRGDNRFVPPKHGFPSSFFCSRDITPARREPRGPSANLDQNCFHAPFVFFLVRMDASGRLDAPRNADIKKTCSCEKIAVSSTQPCPPPYKTLLRLV